MWEVATGRLLHVLEGPGQAIEWVSWHPQGDIILAGSEDFSVWMWNARSGAFMQVLPVCLHCIPCELSESAFAVI